MDFSSNVGVFVHNSTRDYQNQIDTIWIIKYNMITLWTNQRVGALQKWQAVGWTNLQKKGGEAYADYSYGSYLLIYNNNKDKTQQSPLWQVTIVENNMF